MYLDTEACVRAVSSRDARFDGWFYTAVKTTGIYCRPSCPATTPKARNMVFYPSAAAAQSGGFRACKRCRPDTSPGSPEWNVRADLVARAMRLIADGVVDREGVAGLARQLGYSVRQIERQVRRELGAGPLALARAQRAQTARVLVETSDLPMADIAFAAGFGSIRAFNDTVREVFSTTPREMRSRATHSKTTEPAVGADSWHHLRLRLPFRRPFLPDNVFGHLAATAVPGVEEWRDGAYRRTLRLPHGPGVVALAPQADHVAASLWLTDLRDLMVATSRCRWMLDLDADPEAVDTALSADERLAPLVAGAPGRRVPRSADSDEMAIRIVLGQQVSTKAARTHGARLVAALGDPLAAPVGGLTHLFPTSDQVRGTPPEHLAMPASRQRTVVALAGALADGEIDLTLGSDWEMSRSTLLALPGIGPWSVESIAMRALGDPDAFPSSDLGIRAGAARIGIADQQPTILAEAAAWRPWRAYAAQHLWATTDHEINHLPKG
ncbi:AlkA N-terminal domain-containing protein [Luteipulveratus halotolerans]|uniref:DNA-3-methyladenine glycosylase II n=1 Tax=Luteipulveratus halotolerans TaxID=1631356 RepID=A0A0L6CED4_9MICO|nr:AlkA N-terminal domain-containing protein [Luteipulveratus halotolerans]KNX36172.1 DNA-3-methyladenine glycosylase [Luteipulveratus halotolerans]